MEILQYPLAFLLLLGVIVVFTNLGTSSSPDTWYVVRFSVGFGKPLLRWSDKYGTEFVLAAILLRLRADVRRSRSRHERS